MKERGLAKTIVSQRVVTVEAGELSTVIGRLTSHGKVLLVVGQTDYLRVGEQLTDEIDACPQSFYRFVVGENRAFRDYAPMFSFPEDVRAVLAVGANAIAAAKYFCTLRNVPYAFLPLSPDGEDVFCPSVAVTEEQVLSARLPEFVVVTPLLYECPRSQIAAAYGRVMSKMIALTDYRVRCLCTACPMNKDGYDYARAALIDAMGLTADTPKTQQIQVLLSASLRFSVLTAEYGDDAPCYGAEKGGAMLLKGGEYGDRAFACAIKMVEIYRLSLNYLGVAAPVPDYDLRLSRAASLAGVSERWLLSKTQIPRFSDHAKREKLLQNFRVEFQEEFAKMQELLPSIQRIYRTYGGNYLAKVKKEDFLKAINYSPELSTRYNLATFIRDAGLLENLGEKQ